MKLLEKPSFQWIKLPFVVAIFMLYGCASPVAEPVATQAQAKTIAEPANLMGHWCREVKRRITRYTVSEGKLKIVGGRSGQTHEADLSCNENYTECEARTIRGWQSPVTEILRVDGENMNLTRIWGGAWKDKTYNFIFTRCPKF